MPLPRPVLPVLSAAFAAALFALVLFKVGVAPLGLAAVALIALALLARPPLAVGVAIALPVLIENDPQWGPVPQLDRYYDLIGGARIDPAEAVVLLALAAVVVDPDLRRGGLHRVSVMGAPLATLALGLVIGVVTGLDAGVGVKTVIDGGRSAVPLLLVPLLVCAVVGGPGGVTLRRALNWLFALAAVKAVVGLMAYATGQSAESGAQHITYYLAPANIITMFGLVFVVGAALRRLRLPWWVWAAGPFLVGSLLFSFRRSFWLGTTLGLLIVVVVVLGRARRFALPVAAAGIVAAVLAIGGHTGGSGLVTAGADSPSSVSVASRLKSINPASISANKDDRYRIGERRNVVADLREHPISGLGIGVPYVARYPLTVGTIDHSYVHFAALWWWMKGGIAGLVGYIGLLLCCFGAGIRILRHHPDPVIAVAGAAGAAGIAGLAFAELTATFVGPDVRGSILLGALVGLLGAGWREATDARDLARLGPAVPAR